MITNITKKEGLLNQEKKCTNGNKTKIIFNRILVK